MGFHDQRCRRILARISRIEPRLISQDDQAIRLDQIRDQRAQSVVVAQTDLVRGDGIVFIDDGHGAQFEQGTQGGPCVQVARTVGQIFVCQQHLCGMQTVCAKNRLVGLHHTCLAYCCSCLEFIDGLGSFLPAQTGDALGNGTRRDQYDLFTLRSQCRNLLCPPCKGQMIEPPAFCRHEARPDLDDNPPGLSDNRMTHLIARFRLRTASAPSLTRMPSGQK